MPQGEQNDDDGGDDAAAACEGDDEEGKEGFNGIDPSSFLPEPGRSDATATARISPRRTPAATAVPTATRSAQIPAGYAAFSTLAPV